MRRNHGFTLMELVITIAVIGILSSLGLGPILESVRAHQETTARLRLLDEARLALEVMGREIREVRSSADIATFTNTVFDFVRADATNVRYELSGSELLRNAASACGFVTAFDFDFLDGSGAAAAAAADIRLVTYTITVSTGGQTVKLRSSAAPRALLTGWSNWEEQ